MDSAIKFQASSHKVERKKDSNKDRDKEKKENNMKTQEYRESQNIKK